MAKRIQQYIKDKVDIYDGKSKGEIEGINDNDDKGDEDDEDDDNGSIYMTILTVTDEEGVADNGTSR